MKNLITITVCLFLLSSPSLSAQLDAFWTQEIYRTGSILNYERKVNGTITHAGSNEKVNNWIYNHFIETNGVYSRVDLSIMMFLLPLNNDQNQHWSLNFTLGTLLYDDPLEIGGVNMNFGVGVDFDLTSTKIQFTDGTSVDLETGTIGVNARVDIELTDWLLLKNSVTYGWWRSDSARKLDIRSVVNVKLLDGLYLTATPNYLSHTSSEEENGQVTDISAQHFYLTFGVGVDW